MKELFFLSDPERTQRLDSYRLVNFSYPGGRVADFYTPKPGKRTSMLNNGELHLTEGRTSGVSDTERTAALTAVAATFMTLDDEYAFLLVEDVYREGEKK